MVSITKYALNFECHVWSCYNLNYPFAVLSLGITLNVMWPLHVIGCALIEGYVFPSQKVPAFVSFSYGWT